MSGGSESSTRVIVFRSQQRVELKVEGTWSVDPMSGCSEPQRRGERGGENGTHCESVSAQ